jgi:hypothetical protein|tara:strand:- start:14966 stop:15163 length:198 start_codon:yes stop_codon:yes gene_type:complete
MNKKQLDLQTEDAAAVNTGVIPNPADTAMGPKAKQTRMYDKRRKMDKPPVLLKRFQKFIEDSPNG